MNSTNVAITALGAQAKANQKFDPEVPKPVTQQVIKGGPVHTDGFCSNDMDAPAFLALTGILFIVYGWIAK